MAKNGRRARECFVFQPLVAEYGPEVHTDECRPVTAEAAGANPVRVVEVPGPLSVRTAILNSSAEVSGGRRKLGGTLSGFNSPSLESWPSQGGNAGANPARAILVGCSRLVEAINEEDHMTEPCPGYFGCSNEAVATPHTCPFKEDVDGDSSTLCTCCASCESDCADEI